MTVKVYISRNPDGSECVFRETYERAASLQVAKALWRIYQPVAKRNYALIFNLQNPPADLVILSTHGMAVIDLKHIGNPVKGTDDSKWYILDNGQEIVIPNGHLNPARQIRDYKWEIERQLRDFAHKHKNLPEWMRKDGGFYTQGAVLFTADRFSLDGIKLSPRVAIWLKLLFLDGLSDWVNSCSFNRSNQKGQPESRLTTEQLEHIACDLFRVTPWTEIDNLLGGGEPYGYLFLIEGNLRRVRMNLDTEIVRIGRSRNNDISLESEYVSGTHCQITHRADGTYLEDLGSRNGTSVNGIPVLNGEKKKIKSGDEIVLGLLVNGIPDATATVLRYIASTQHKTAATKLY